MELMPQRILTTAKWTALLRKPRKAKPVVQQLTSPDCGGGSGKTDVMGYHDAREIPNYWALAQNFRPAGSAVRAECFMELPQHLFMVSEWSAKCSVAGDPMSCINALQAPGNPPDFHPKPECYKSFLRLIMHGQT
jgi:hypothetical protein